MKVHLRWVFLLDGVSVRGASCAASCNFQLRTLLRSIIVWRGWLVVWREQFIILLSVQNVIVGVDRDLGSWLTCSLKMSVNNLEKMTLKLIDKWEADWHINPQKVSQKFRWQRVQVMRQGGQRICVSAGHWKWDECWSAATVFSPCCWTWHRMMKNLSTILISKS
jgi:hypothetical protein